MNEVIKALREASISVACGLEWCAVRKDIEHIQTDYYHREFFRSVYCRGTYGDV